MGIINACRIFMAAMIIFVAGLAAYEGCCEKNWLKVVGCSLAAIIFTAGTVIRVRRNTPPS